MSFSENDRYPRGDSGPNLTRIHVAPLQRRRTTTYYVVDPSRPPSWACSSTLKGASAPNQRP